MHIALGELPTVCMSLQSTVPSGNCKYFIPYIEIHSAPRELLTIHSIEMHSALRESQTINYIEMHSALGELPTICMSLQSTVPSGNCKYFIPYIQMHSAPRELQRIYNIEINSALTACHQLITLKCTVPSGNYKQFITLKYTVLSGNYK